MSGWWVYILRCGDGTLYTGMTDDPERRLAAHRSGHGAKYTRGAVRWSWSTARPVGPAGTPCAARRPSSACRARRSCG
ncbi:MAG: GIY-YIG nuclease family protein [Oscillospiraceae bacterium]|nr:GIY-YIG nuclease family protein [Oscillospiraceae bacterium]